MKEIFKLLLNVLFVTIKLVIKLIFKHPPDGFNYSYKKANRKFNRLIIETYAFMGTNNVKIDKDIIQPNKDALLSKYADFTNSLGGKVYTISPITNNRLFIKRERITLSYPGLDQDLMGAWNHLLNTVTVLSEVNTEIQLILANKTNERLVKVNTILTVVGIIDAIVLGTVPVKDYFNKIYAANALKKKVAVIQTVRIQDIKQMNK